MVHLYCGDGKGKTTASCGLALRAAGGGLKVLYASFLKNGDSSEVAPLESVKNITCLKPDKAFGWYNTLDEKKRTDVSVLSEALLSHVISVADGYDVIVLDEAVSSCNLAVINGKRLLQFLKSSGGEKEIVLTGRGPSRELIEVSDYVTEMKKVRHPYDRGILARKGIEY